MINIVVVGVVLFLFSGNLLYLVLGYVGFFVIGVIFWYWEWYCECCDEVLLLLG